MNFDIWRVVVGQVLRHFFSIFAAGLAAYGVSENQQGEIVESAIVIIISVAMFLAVQAWAYISKRVAFSTPVEQEVQWEKYQ
jgi:putative exporter of polyketide antibiotics